MIQCYLLNLVCGYYMGIYFFSRFIKRHSFGKGEGEGYTSNEKEKGEDHVVELETVPWDVVKLSGPPFKYGPSCECGETGEYTFATHDPEHVKPPEGIKGMKTFWLLIIFHDTLFR